MLLRLNTAEVAAFKEKYEVEAKFKPGEIRDLITTDLEARISEEGSEEVEFIEDLEGEALEVPEEGVMIDVEDNVI